MLWTSATNAAERPNVARKSGTQQNVNNKIGFAYDPLSNIGGVVFSTNNLSYVAISFLSPLPSEDVFTATAIAADTGGSNQPATTTAPPRLYYDWLEHDCYSVRRAIATIAHYGSTATAGLRRPTSVLYQTPVYTTVYRCPLLTEWTVWTRRCRFSSTYRSIRLDRCWRLVDTYHWKRAYSSGLGAHVLIRLPAARQHHRQPTTTTTTTIVYVDYLINICVLTIFHCALLTKPRRNASRNLENHSFVGW